MTGKKILSSCCARVNCEVIRGIEILFPIKLLNRSEKSVNIENLNNSYFIKIVVILYAVNNSRPV